MTKLLEEILQTCTPYTKEGKLADYIPELTKANPEDFGIFMIRSDHVVSKAGDYDKQFTIQSIIKPIFLSVTFIVICLLVLQSLPGSSKTTC